MLFEARFWPLIADGSVTVTFRRWKRRQVIAGNRYRTAAGRIEVDAVDVVAADDITDDEAIQSGFASAAAVLGDLRGTPDLPIYRIRFHLVDEPDPREELAATAALDDDDVADIDRRLDRLDRASSSGPWTETASR